VQAKVYPARGVFCAGAFFFIARELHALWPKMPRACPHDAKLANKHHCQAKKKIFNKKRGAGTPRGQRQIQAAQA
jgi:hypothetical protein